MRRAVYTFLFTTLATGFIVLVGGCNNHPLDNVEYDHWTGQAPGTETSGEDSYVGSESGTEDSETGNEDDTTGTEETGEPEPICGNGIIEPPEVCDDGMDNGPYPRPCSDSCTLNPPE